VDAACRQRAPAGAILVVLDELRTITATNTLSIARAGSDTIEGGTASIVLSSAGATVSLMTDGTSKWTLVAQKRSVNIQVFTANGTYTPAVGARSALFRVDWRRWGRRLVSRCSFFVRLCGWWWSFGLVS
jgi:hypothetical protein